jgi:hypothetical protein
MANLSTKDIKTGGALPKTLQPGNVVCKINGLTLEEFKLKEGALILILNLESQPIDGFEGFLVDKDVPDGPKFKGQVGNIKAGEWAFADGETKGGTPISRDEEILKFMKNLCVALDCVKWLDEQDGKHATIESLFNAFVAAGKYKNVFLEFCLAGKEYMSKNNYTNYDLFLPRYTKQGAPFGPVMKDPKKSKVVVFDSATHIKKKKSSEVTEFADGPGDVASDAGGPGEGPSEFQL